MIPLIDIPEIVKHYAPKFEFLFTTAEFSKFQKYISGLIVSENKTIEAINRLFVFSDFVKQLHEEQKTKLEKGDTQKLPFTKCTIKYKGKKEVYYNYCKISDCNSL